MKSVFISNHPSAHFVCCNQPLSSSHVLPLSLSLIHIENSFFLHPNRSDSITSRSLLASLLVLIPAPYFFFGGGVGGYVPFPPYLMCNSARPRQSFLSHIFYIFYSYKATRESILVNIASSCRPFRLRSLSLSPNVEGVLVRGRGYIFEWRADIKR